MSKVSNRVYSLILLSFIAFGVNAEEEYYTWVDENGVVNYAERNPEGVVATFVGRNQAFGRPAPAPRQAADAPESLPKTDSGEIDPDALVDERATAMAAGVAETKRRNCEIGKKNLAQLKAFARIRVSDEKGQNRVISDEEKEAKAEEARTIIRNNCSG